jgi:predicted nucleic-acid-binding protein
MEGVMASRMLVDRVVDLEYNFKVVRELIDVILERLPEYDKYLVARKEIMERANKMRAVKAKKRRIQEAKNKELVDMSAITRELPGESKDQAKS